MNLAPFLLIRDPQRDHALAWLRKQLGTSSG
jgi:hypothetical protein